MKPATRVFLMVVAVQGKAMLDSQRRILSAFEKWLEAQPDELRTVMSSETTAPTTRTLSGLQ